MAVGGHDSLVTAEGGDQHQQGGFRQVEIGDQGIHHPKGVAGADEETGLSLEGRQVTGGGGGLQAAHARRPHRHHPTTPGMGRRDLGADLGIHLQPLRMHGVFVQILYPHRLEGAGADVEGDMGGGDPQIRQPLEHVGVEVQSGGWRRHRPGPAGIDGLVAFQIRFLVRALDIRRQGHVAVPFH